MPVVNVCTETEDAKCLWVFWLVGLVCFVLFVGFVLVWFHFGLVVLFVFFLIFN